MTEERIDGEETKENKKPKKSLKRELMEDVIMIVFVLVTVWVMKNYVLINAVIPSASMEDTIMTGDRIFGSRLSYEFGEPQRGDIAIFKFPDDESQLYIKRVIGLPGDKVQIIDGKVYINDSETPLDEPYLRNHRKAIMDRIMCRKTATLCWEITETGRKTPGSGQIPM